MPCICYGHILWLVSEHFHAHHCSYHLLEDILFKCHLSFFLYSGCQVTSLPIIYVTPFKINCILQNLEAAEGDIIMIITCVIKSRRVKLAGHLVYMGERRHAHRFVV